ncbi:MULTISPECIES: cytochrome P450 [unclassified Streptomyces]|uniref:cytochrome P450 n=1 Tax=unclassified Streptomyces TaxID=2593676 RepID=UPI001BE7C5D5|nr:MULTISPECIES: cytochrome P450 [unclassified Streptomyces]MBT2402877.1 cytochrome P450 [Streptomyces sp. ISL-21]MBT2454867.1 cytochrome P450 [Streptomyces sp. ISL-86]MBT2612017.1 cytochrome P450 [Streptomyces sp. ISL-87]
MTTTANPIEAVRLPDPYPVYARLVAEDPFAYDEALRAWVAADAAAVRKVLGSGALRVRPPAEPVPAGITGTAAGEVFGELVRMTDGDLQRRLKVVVVDALGRADMVRAAGLAAGFTREVLAAGGRIPYEELMFGVPARVVAALSGLTDGADVEAARAIGDFVQCIPASATAEQQRAAAVAAGRLRELLRPGFRAGGTGLLGELVQAADRASWPHMAPLLSNAVGFLSQTYDATAGLIGNTLVALARGAAVPGTAQAAEALVREVVRHDAPIQNTRRFAAEPFAHAGSKVEPGQQVLVVLAAANRDPAVNQEPHFLRPGRVNPVVFTFGGGAHQCPGGNLAVTLATAVVTELLAAGLTPAELPADPAYRPLANARIPLI